MSESPFGSAGYTGTARQPGVGPTPPPTGPQMNPGGWEGANPALSWIGERAQWFENLNLNPVSTWGEEKSNWAKALDSAGSLLAAASSVPLGVMNVIGAAQMNVIDRPISTLLQATEFGNPLYDDGFQWDDITRMWEASEQEIGVGRAFANWAGGANNLLTGAQKDGYADYLSPMVGLDPDFNPYAMSDEQRRDLNNNAIYNIGTGLADLGYDIGMGVIGDKGVGVVRRAAGLSRNARKASDLRGLEYQIDVHQNPATPNSTIVGEQVDRIAASKDLRVIRAQGVTRGIRDRGILYALQKETDPIVVGKIVRAARGDRKAIHDLTMVRPDTAFVASGAQVSLANAINKGYRITDDTNGQKVVESATEAMFEADPAMKRMRDLFWQKRPWTGDYKIGMLDDGTETFVPRVETTALPAGVPVQDTRLTAALGKAGAARLGEKAAAGQASRRAGIAAAKGADIQPGKWMSRVLGIPGVTPMVRTVMWSGQGLPNGMLTLSPTQPEDAARELVAQTMEIRAWKSLTGQKRVTFRTASGTVKTMNAEERKNDIERRVLAAQASGRESEIVKVIRDIEEENLGVLFQSHSVLGGRRGLLLNQDDFDKIVMGVVQSSNRGHGKVQVDDIVMSREGAGREGISAGQPGSGGYYVDPDGTMVVTDPLTLRGLANSWVTLPMRDIEQALLATTPGLKGTYYQATDYVRKVRDTAYGIARASMLIRAGYIPKNAIGDPVLARFFALGEVFGPDGGVVTAMRFWDNMKTRGMELRAALRLGGVSRTDVSRTDTKVWLLHQQRMDYEDEIKRTQEQIDAIAGETDPDLVTSKAELEERIRFAAEARATVAAELDFADPQWRTSPVAYDTLHDVERRWRVLHEDLQRDPGDTFNEIINGWDEFWDEVDSVSRYQNVLETGRLSRAIADLSAADPEQVGDTIAQMRSVFDAVKADRQGRLEEIRTRIADLGIPEMPLIQRAVWNFERYARITGDLPRDWHMWSWKDKEKWARNWTKTGPGRSTVWGLEHPRAADVKKPGYHRETMNAYGSGEGHTLPPAAVFAEVGKYPPGTRLYRAMSVAEWDALNEGGVELGVTELGVRSLGTETVGDTNLPMVAQAGTSWGVEGIGREGHGQRLWWTSLPSEGETGGGWGSFWDREGAEVVVEVVLEDPSQQVFRRTEVGNDVVQSSPSNVYTGNIPGDWEARTIPGSYLRVTRVWATDEPTVSQFDDNYLDRIPINMGPDTVDDGHWYEYSLPDDGHIIIDVETGGTHTAQHRVTSTMGSRMRRVQGGSWMREKELIERDLEDIEYMERVLDAYAKQEGLPLREAEPRIDRIEYGPDEASDTVLTMGTARVWNRGENEVWGERLAPSQWSPEQRAAALTYVEQYRTLVGRTHGMVPGFRFMNGYHADRILRDAVVAEERGAKGRIGAPPPVPPDERRTARLGFMAALEADANVDPTDPVDVAMFVSENPDLVPDEIANALPDSWVDADMAEAVEMVSDWYERNWESFARQVEEDGWVEEASGLGLEGRPPVEVVEPEIPERWDGVPFSMVYNSKTGEVFFSDPKEARRYIGYVREFGGTAGVPVRAMRSATPEQFEGDYLDAVPTGFTPHPKVKDGNDYFGDQVAQYLSDTGLGANPTGFDHALTVTEYIGRRTSDDLLDDGRDWLEAHATGPVIDTAEVARRADAIFRRPRHTMSAQELGQPDQGYGFRARGIRMTETQRERWDELMYREKMLEKRIDLIDSGQGDDELIGMVDGLGDLVTDAKERSNLYLSGQAQALDELRGKLSAAETMLATTRSDLGEATAEAGRLRDTRRGYKEREQSGDSTTRGRLLIDPETGRSKFAIARRGKEGEGRVFVHPITRRVMWREDWTAEEQAKAGWIPAEDAYSDAPGVYGTAFKASNSMSPTYAAQNDPFNTQKIRRREDRLRQSVGSGRAIPEGDTYYFPALENTVNRHIRGDLLGEAFLRGATQEDVAALLATPAGYEYRKRMGWNMDVTEASKVYETERIAQLADLVETYLPNEAPVPPEILERYGLPDGTDLHTLVSQVEITAPELEQILGGWGQPLRTIHGQEWTATLKGAGEAMKNLQESIWEKWMVRPETRFGSNPAAVSFYRRALSGRAQLLREQGVQVTPDVLEGLIGDAQREALEQAQKTIYHVDRNTRALRVAGNFTAFPAAYVNAIVRYTRLALNNPGRAAMVNQFMESATDPTSWWWSGEGPTDLQVQDENGNLKDPNEPLKNGDRVVLAVPEWMRTLLPPGQSEGITITPSALALFGQKPSLHPYVATVTSLAYTQEELEAMVGKETADTLFEFGLPETGFERFLPGWSGGAFSEFETTASEVNRQFTADMIQWEQNGAQGEPPTWEDSMRRLQDGAIMRAASRFFSPGGLAPTREGTLAMAQYRAIQDKHGDDPEKVQEEWSRLFPKVDLPLSVTEYGTYGYIPATRAAKDTLDEHVDLVRAVAATDPALVGVLTVGDDGEFDGTISGWLRENSYAPGAKPYLDAKSPVEAAADRARAEGWDAYKQAKTAYDNYLSSLGITDRSAEAEPYRAQFEAWKQQLAESNPAWAADYTDGFSRKAPGVIRTMRAALADEAFMASKQGNPTWETAGYFVQAHEQAVQAYAAATTPDERNLIVGQFEAWVGENLATRGDGFADLWDTYLSDGRSLVGGGF